MPKRNKKVVFIFTEDDADPYCGVHIKKVFSTIEKAKKEMLTVEEWDRKNHNIEELEVE